MSVKDRTTELQRRIPKGVTLVAVSKTYPAGDIMEAYEAGQRVFGESRPQELKQKWEELPKDIRWHMIGHLQTNKVKYIAPFVELIHSVDNRRLLEIIDKEATKRERTIDVLLEVFIAQEESKHGWEAAELREYLSSGEFRQLKNIRIRGLMGIASLTDDKKQIHREFSGLRDLFKALSAEYFGGVHARAAATVEGRADEKGSEATENRAGENGGGAFDILSMGMTSDWEIAVECGANMVRIGSMIFGAREYPNAAQ